ncbi:uncharacterized protein LOC135847616 isoform X3 [Planococcus citri]|uniref:uncharacterized protein LOC135847616 isoform X3 n=1 Tax=Planococcus citri TaxID=170843 RepID=UPI0031FA0F5B
MDEIMPVVYDIAQPTPVPLKDLSAIAVSLEIWRHELQERRRSNSVDRFFSSSWDISSNSVLPPGLLPVIYNVIDKYMPRFGPSATTWLSSQYRTTFHLHRTHQNSVLEVFDDFVFDYNGTIDYVRTAKRMMDCDRFSLEEKFAIACTYFFEDDIRRIWPSVFQSFDSDSIRFSKCPQLYYWICCLRNERDKIPRTTNRNRSVDEVMLDHHMFENKPSFEYFWGRVSLENQMRKAKNTNDKKLLVTFVLSKLNDHQLDEFINTDGCKLIMNLLNDRLRCRWFVQPTWNFIKNKMNESTFKTLVIGMLRLELKSGVGWSSRLPQNWLHCYSEIWNGIPTNVKRSIVEDILSNGGFSQMNCLRCADTCKNGHFVGFLLLILSSATFEQRSTFWRDGWLNLFKCVRIDDLKRIRELCFENEDEITQFMGNIIAVNTDMRRWCRELLSFGMFDELNDLVDFCWPDVEAAKRFKLQLLQSSFLGEDSRLTPTLFQRVDEFSIFIDGTFDNNDQSADFKNQLMSTLAAQGALSDYPFFLYPSFEKFMKLVDTFVSTEETVRVIKMGIINYLTRFSSTGGRNYRFYHDRHLKTPGFGQFLLWLLGSAEEVERLRQTYVI